MLICLNLFYYHLFTFTIRFFVGALTIHNYYIIKNIYVFDVIFFNEINNNNKKKFKSKLIQHKVVCFLFMNSIHSFQFNLVHIIGQFIFVFCIPVVIIIIYAYIKVISFFQRNSIWKIIFSSTRIFFFWKKGTKQNQKKSLFYWCVFQSTIESILCLFVCHQNVTTNADHQQQQQKKHLKICFFIFNL